MATIQDLGKVAYFNKGVYNSETTYEINDVVSYNGSSYVSLGNDNLGNLPTNTAFWSLVASKGEKGDTGKAFVIEKTYATIEDMVADYDNMNVDDYVMIQGSIEDEENATLWTKTDTEVSPYKWVYLADFSGASGITGATPNIQIGTVTEGNEPSVTRRAGSTNENPILDFVLKTGAKGDTGATGNGISGVAKTSTSGLVDTYTISYTSGNSSTFDVHNGKGISSIAKTSSVGLVDTYTITYNDGTTSTFEITNGEDGEVTQEQLDETNAEVERVNMVYNALPKVSGEGTSLSLNNTAECPVYDVELSPSELEQETTTGKNKFNINALNIINATIQNNKLILTGTNDYHSTNEGNNLKDIANLTVGETYTLKFNTTYTGTNNNKVYLRGSTSYWESGTSHTVTQAELDDRIAFYGTNNAEISNIQIEKGSTATEYEEYTGGQPSPSPEHPQDIHVVSGENTITISNSDNTQSQTYPISLGDLEYCKIGNYEDVFFKNVVGSTYYDSTLQVGKWYLKKNIGKVVLDGSENWTLSSASSDDYYIFQKNERTGNAYEPTMYSNNFTGGGYISSSQTLDYEGVFYNDSSSTNSYLRICIKGLRLSEKTSTAFKNWLSTHNTILYYVSNTPTYTLLNNTLQTQLDNLSNAISYNQQTNVSQVNDDLPFVIKLSAIRDLSGIFELIQG